MVFNSHEHHIFATQFFYTMLPKRHQWPLLCHFTLYY